MTNIVLYKDVNNNLWLYEGYDTDIKMHKVIVVDEDDGYYTNTNITCYLTDEELAQCTEVHINIHKYEDDDCVPTVYEETPCSEIGENFDDIYPLDNVHITKLNEKGDTKVYFKQFISAFANEDYAKTLVLWDKYHKTFKGQQIAVANEIIKMIDLPKPLF